MVSFTFKLINYTHKIVLNISILDSIEEKNDLIIKDLSNELIYNDDLIKNEQFDVDLQVNNFLASKSSSQRDFFEAD